MKFFSLLCGASLTALCLSAATSAAEITADTTAAPRASESGMVENRYYMMMLSDTFDGIQTRSYSQKMAFARIRSGDESFVALDYGDGAMAIKQNDDLRISGFHNEANLDATFTYDYRTNTLSGNTATSEHHNRFVRPLLNQSPALGTDARWSIRVTPAQLGAEGVDGKAFGVNLSREYFSASGRDYVLVSYDAPAFSYTDSSGNTVVHWAKGVALADPGFGQIYWTASRQQAVARVEDAAPRPYRFAKTFYAMDRNGRPLVDVSQLKRMEPVLASMRSGDGVDSRANKDLLVQASQSPLQLAALIDIAALSVAENSANQLGETAGSFYFGDSGQAAGQFVDNFISTWTTPDKFVSALGGVVAQAGKGVDFAIDVAARQKAVDDFIAAANASEAKAQRMNGAVQALRSQYMDVVRRTTEIRRAAMQALEFNPNVGGQARTLEEFVFRGMPAKAEIQQLERDAAILLRNLTSAETNLKTQLAGIQRLQPYKEAMVAAMNSAPSLLNNARVAFSQTLSSQSAKALAGAIDAMNLQHVFAAAGGIGNVATMFTAGENLRTFDPSAGGDLRMTGNYDSLGGFVRSLGLDILGVAGATASGNPVAAVSEVVTFASGRFTDLFIAMEAANAAKGAAKTAEMQATLTHMRYLKLLDDKRARDLAEFYAQLARTDAALADLKNDLDKGKNNPPIDTSGNPHFDPKTGLPTAWYWGYLKRTDPEALRRMGIDPDAPVGGWPGGVKPKPPVDTPVVVDVPQQPGGPNYPIAKPKKPVAKPPGPQDDSMPEIPSESDAPVTSEVLTANPKPRDTTTVIVPPVQANNKPYTPPPSTTEWLNVSPLTVTPLVVSPLEWKPVVFKPVEWKPVTWTPPKWVPVTFKPPVASEIPWTKFDGGNDWPDAGQNLAYSFGDMQGKVATDLTRWQAWLATQNVKHLEDLARAGGYPNLASALNNAALLIKQSKDSGYRDYAFGPPAFSGSISIAFSRQQLDMARAQVLLGDLLGLNSRYFETSNTSNDDRPMVASLLDDQSAYLTQLNNNGRGGLTSLLAQPFNVLLTWGAGAFDLDLHMTGPTGAGQTDRFHIYYVSRGSLTAAPFAELITDCICRSGSEVILTSQLVAGGVYRISVFNFGDQSASSTNLSSAAGAQLQIVRGGTAVSVGNGTTIQGGRVIYTGTPPTGVAGNTWLGVEINAATGRITAPNTIGQSGGSESVR